MNVVIFSDAFLPKVDGIGISIDHFCRILGKRGHKFMICCPEYDEGNFDRIGDHSNIIRFKNFALPSYQDVKVILPSRKRINKAMTSFRPDLVHIHSPGLLGQQGIYAARLFDVPMIGTYHTLVSEMGAYISPYRLLKVDRLFNSLEMNKKIKKNIDKFIYKNERALTKKVIMRIVNGIYEAGDAIISPSQLIKDHLITESVTTPIHVVSNGMDLMRFRREVRPGSADPPRFLHVGRISFEKNADVVLQAFKLIREKMPAATLDVIGDGPALPSLKLEARTLEISDHVKFHGFIANQDLPEIYPQYDIFLTASTMETQGLVVLEALASGVPCVGVDSYALPELILHEKNGFVVPPFEPAQMAEAAIRLVSDARRYKKFSGASIETANQHDIDRCADRLEDVYVQYGK